MKKRFPDRPPAHSEPYGGIENLRPETVHWLRVSTCRIVSYPEKTSRAPYTGIENLRPETQQPLEVFKASLPQNWKARSFESAFGSFTTQ